MTNLEKAKAITEITKELDKIADRLYEECGLPPFRDEVSEEKEKLNDH